MPSGWICVDVVSHSTRPSARPRKATWEPAGSTVSRYCSVRSTLAWNWAGVVMEAKPGWPAGGRGRRSRCRRKRGTGAARAAVGEARGQGHKTMTDSNPCGPGAAVAQKRLHRSPLHTSLPMRAWKTRAGASAAWERARALTMPGGAMLLVRAPLTPRFW